jgi:hypothetical protein
MENDINNFGFIMLRHVNNKDTNEYWNLCYDSIRKFYPENNILIIDDNSEYKYINNRELYKVTIINCEYPKRGELLPYYYYLKNKLFDTAVIIHDSVFINKILNRYNRCSFERVIAVLLQKNGYEPTLLGNIMKYCKFGVKFNKINL